jgi:hypothetical protein
VLFPADGSFDDTRGGRQVENHGATFAAGRVGQGFYFDGSSFLTLDGAGYYRFIHSYGVAFYARFEADPAGMVLLDAKSGVRFGVSRDRRLVFTDLRGGGNLSGHKVLDTGAWYHLAISVEGDRATLYIDGEPDAAGPGFRREGGTSFPLFIGATFEGQPGVRGWMDEIAFYSRALSAKDVQSLYRMRESGPCAVH